ncbi:hypothetical protein LCGC14_1130200 [marine sediment metagenome]|uniref:Uncharacterized protein n=1 Tax=marine sediment metagenome TaxID=412755 RepID=A0A0F9M645_9ZZZZ
MIYPEQKAKELGLDKTRLLDARLTMTLSARKDFGKGMYQFNHRRLVSDDGTWALVWQLRKQPNEPISYENQQTSIGTVTIHKLAFLNRRMIQ